MDKLLLLTEPFLTDLKPIKAWLASVGVEGWSINAYGLVDVAGDVDLQRKLGELKRLPVRFGNVGGGFNCQDNQLVSLEGAPKKVGWHFNCYKNQLVSLEGGPIEVGGDFNCYNNQLVSLEGAPKHIVGDFTCYYNQLVSLEGAPKAVGGSFLCFNNQLVNLKGAPEKIGMAFYCSNNQLVNLEGAPETVGGDFGCSSNQLVGLKGVSLEVGGDFDCVRNLLADFKGLEGVRIEGDLFVTGSSTSEQDNVFVSLEGLPKYLYSKVVGLDIPVTLELERKRAASLLSDGVAELSSEVGLG